MSSLVERIRNNDPELQQLRLVESPEAYCADMSDLIEALGSNTVVNYVRIDRDFLPGMEPDFHSDFFKAVGKVSNLKDARFWHASIPVAVLASFVQEARRIEFLELGCLDLEGSDEDFKMIADNLKEHPTLTGFSMSDFSLNDDTVVIDGLVESLATIPNLKSVKLEVTHSRRRSIVGSTAAAKKVKVSLSGKALAGLVRAPKIESLHLNRLNLKLSDYENLTSSMKGEQCLLKSFAIPHCSFTDESAAALAPFISGSKTLEKLDLTCNGLTDEGCRTVAAALKDSQSIRLVRMWGNTKITQDGFDAMEETVKNHLTLERVPLMTPLAARS